jgi:hypothetical protein
MIVNTVLNEHQLVLDIVAFVQKGDFPRSRLGEKQRGKILASWVSRKMRTIAQFSIRDPDAEGSVGTAVPNETNRRGSVQSVMPGSGGFRGGPGSINNTSRNPGTAGSSLRHVESISQLPLSEEEAAAAATLYETAQPPQSPPHMPPQIHIDEQQTLPPPSAEYMHEDDNHTPTNERQEHDQLDSLNTTLQYSPIEGSMMFGPGSVVTASGDLQQQQQGYFPPPLNFGGGNGNGNNGGVGHRGQSEPQSPDEMPVQPRMGGLRVANRSGSMSSEDEEDWSKDALRQLNLNR